MDEILFGNNELNRFIPICREISSSTGLQTVAGRRLSIQKNSEECVALENYPFNKKNSSKRLSGNNTSLPTELYESATVYCLLCPSEQEGP